MNTAGNQALFSPLRLGALRLAHRIVMAPLTRSRATQPDSVPTSLMKTYYEQRASQGGLIVTEATNVSLRGRGWLGSPGLYSAAQIAGWVKIVDAIHAKGGLVMAQLWHTGRSSHVAMTGGATPVTASIDPSYWQDPKHLVSIPGGWTQPSPHRALAVDEIEGVVDDYRRAASNAMDAGFDGVEIHAANGYLLDQFLQDGSNRRTDRFGGSIQNRMRLLVDVVGAMASLWGADRVAVRLGPGGRWNGMFDSDPRALFASVVERINAFGLAYLHLIEPRVDGSVTTHPDKGAIATEQLRPLYAGKLIAAGGFEPATADQAVASGLVDAVAFGRHFLANPDLVRRIQDGLPLNPYHRETFYTFDAQGYTDYPAFRDGDELTIDDNAFQPTGNAMTQELGFSLVHAARAGVSSAIAPADSPAGG